MLVLGRYFGSAIKDVKNNQISAKQNRQTVLIKGDSSPSSTYESLEPGRGKPVETEKKLQAYESEQGRMGIRMMQCGASAIGASRTRVYETQKGDQTIDLWPKITPKLGRAELSFCFYRNLKVKFNHLWAFRWHLWDSPLENINLYQSIDWYSLRGTP